MTLNNHAVNFFYCVKIFYILRHYLLKSDNTTASEKFEIGLRDRNSRSKSILRPMLSRGPRQPRSELKELSQ